MVNQLPLIWGCLTGYLPEPNHASPIADDLARILVEISP